eukprot:CAMPEP_0185689628 /NCGR_PEP_ID=MMETSP1164-20130828/580_1 /TAXON_ID=1104430 /ORGANISM="Chrysoreinhardia sp, Strain CCMP2950" /LENGTH=127 /DNA_ID=CAMNT_0028356133 /DNA_START=300 /DNA_END=680 /DNA_ORIENTATION=-
MCAAHRREAALVSSRPSRAAAWKTSTSVVPMTPVRPQARAGAAVVAENSVASTRLRVATPPRPRERPAVVTPEDGACSTAPGSFPTTQRGPRDSAAADFGGFRAGGTRSGRLCGACGSPSSLPPTTP